MDNVLQDMVQRLRAIELLLRTQNELLTSMLVELEQLRRSTKASNLGERVGDTSLKSGDVASWTRFARRGLDTAHITAENCVVEPSTMSAIGTKQTCSMR
jgi:hypothetical protein